MEYKVTAISQTDERIPMQRSFSVQDGALMVDGAVQERLNLQLPQPNFNGQLLQLGEPLANSTIYLLSNYGPDQIFSFPILTDGNGNFSERLGDGSYLITGLILLSSMLSFIKNLMSIMHQFNWFQYIRS